MFHPHLASRATRMGLLIFSVVALFAVPLAGAVVTTSAQGDVLLEDQFDDNANSWKLAATRNAKLTVSDGALTIDLSRENAATWATPDMTFPDDLEIEVEVTTPEPSEEGDWATGIIVRANTRTTASAFYQFDVTGGGQWAFVTRTASGKEYKIQKSGKLDDWDPSAANTLKVSASANSFTYSINGTSVGTFEDDTINNDPDTLKYAGLIVNTLKGTSSISVEFRNLKITGEGQVEPTTRPSRTPTRSRRTPTRTPTPQKASKGDVLLEETFEDDNPNGWSVTDKEDVRIAVEDNSLIIDLSKAQWIQWSYPRAMLFPADVDVTVTVINTDPDPAGTWTYGIGVRNYVDNGEEFMYLFEIAGTSNWLFSRLQGSEGIKVIQKATTIRGVKFTSDAENELRIVAVGSHFEFYLNGKKIGEADDDTITPPDESRIVLAAANYSKTDKTVAVFTDFTVVSAAE